MITKILEIDNAILTFIQNNLHSAVLDSIMLAVSWISNGGAVWIAAALLLILTKKYRITGFAILVALALGAVIGDLILKPLVGRIRPFYLHEEIQLLITGLTDFSFPSGHTASSFASATVLYMYNRRWGIFGFALAAVIAFSRLYFYVHYPTDIIGGMILGLISAMISVKIVSLFKKHFVKTH
jgi:undecaprenyl-diphosphatase